MQNFILLVSVEGISMVIVLKNVIFNQTAGSFLAKLAMGKIENNYERMLGKVSSMKTISSKAGPQDNWSTQNMKGGTGH